MSRRSRQDLVDRQCRGFESRRQAELRLRLRADGVDLPEDEQRLRDEEREHRAHNPGSSHIVGMSEDSPRSTR